MEELGKLRLEYKCDGNYIQVFNSPKLCSLVINGYVADSFSGFVSPKNGFVLSGNAMRYDKPVKVEAVMGIAIMRLYYDGVCVGKKLMLFG